MKKETKEIVKKVIKSLKERGLFLATMESCTGGALIHTITSIPGASEITRGGIVAYSTDQKVKFGVRKSLIKKYTVYSKEVAREMAKLAQKIFNSQVGVGITGILSRKDPQYPEKKVGKVIIGVVFKKKEIIRSIFVPPQEEREKEKEIVVREALRLITKILK